MPEKKSFYFLNKWSEGKIQWKSAFQSRSFTIQIIVTVLSGILLALFAPLFLRYIQGIEGVYLYDVVLDHIPARNVSPYIFICLYTLLAFSIVQLSYRPLLLLKALQAYLLLTVMRGFCIYLFPLEPHPALVPLVDPLIDRFFYEQVIVTKDLFFSGHVSILSLLCLVLPSGRDKKVASLLTLVVAILLLVQHAHYTIDVLVAPLAAWIAWKLVEKMANKSAA